MILLFVIASLKLILTAPAFLNTELITVPTYLLDNTPIEDFFIGEQHNFIFINKQQSVMLGWNEIQPNFLSYNITIYDRTLAPSSSGSYLFGDYQTFFLEKSLNQYYINFVENVIKPIRSLENLGQNLFAYEVCYLSQQIVVILSYNTSIKKATLVRVNLIDDSRAYLTDFAHKGSLPGKLICLGDYNMTAFLIEEKMMILNVQAMIIIEIIQMNDVDVNFLKHHKYKKLHNIHDQQFLVKTKNQSYFVYRRNSSNYLNPLTQITNKSFNDGIQFKNKTHLMWLSEDGKYNLRQIQRSSLFIGSKPTTQNFSSGIKVINAQNLIFLNKKIAKFDQSLMQFKYITDQITSHLFIKKVWQYGKGQNLTFISFSNSIISIYNNQTKQYKQSVECFIDCELLQSGHLFVLFDNNPLIQIAIVHYLQIYKQIDSQSSSFPQTDHGLYYLIQNRLGQKNKQTVLAMFIDKQDNIDNIYTQIWQFDLQKIKINKINNTEKNKFISPKKTELIYNSYFNKSIYIQQKNNISINFYSSNGTAIHAIYTEQGFYHFITINNMFITIYNNKSFIFYSLNYSQQELAIDYCYIVTFPLNILNNYKSYLHIFRDTRPNDVPLQNYMIVFINETQTFIYNSIDPFFSVVLPKSISYSQKQVNSFKTKPISSSPVTEIGQIQYFYILQNYNFVTLKMEKQSIITNNQIYVNNISKQCKNLNIQANNFVRILICQNQINTKLVLYFPRENTTQFSYLWSVSLPIKYINSDSYYGSLDFIILGEQNNKQVIYYINFDNQQSFYYSDVNISLAYSKQGKYLLLMNNSKLAVYSSYYPFNKREINITQSFIVSAVDDSGRFIALANVQGKIIYLYQMEKMYQSYNLTHRVKELKFIDNQQLLIVTEFDLMLCSYLQKINSCINIFSNRNTSLFMFAISQQVIALTFDMINVQLQYFNGTKLPSIRTSSSFIRMRMSLNGDLYFQMSGNSFQKWSIGECQVNQQYLNGVCNCIGETIPAESGCGCGEGSYLKQNKCPNCRTFCNKCQNNSGDCLQWQWATIFSIIGAVLVVCVIISICITRKCSNPINSVDKIEESLIINKYRESSVIYE